MNIVQIKEMIDMCKDMAKMCDDLGMLISITAYGYKNTGLSLKGFISFAPYTDKGKRSIYINVKDDITDKTYVSVHDGESYEIESLEDAVEEINEWEEKKDR